MCLTHKYQSATIKRKHKGEQKMMKNEKKTKQKSWVGYADKKYK